MSEAPFSNRELKLMFNEVNEKLDEHAKTHDKILEQVLYTNGKVKKLHMWLTIIGTAVITLLFTNGSELVEFILKII